jgi:hypothetical protein
VLSGVTQVSYSCSAYCYAVVLCNVMQCHGVVCSVMQCYAVLCSTRGEKEPIGASSQSASASLSLLALKVPAGQG